jgi:phosphohistidine phosphatase
MKRLIIMRHAKSDWSAGVQEDHERPLNHRGQREAPLVAAELAASGFTPDRVISSDSVRTRETWERMSGRFPKARATFDAKLYLAGIDAARALVAAESDDVETVLILGHNPGWEDMAGALAGNSLELKTANAAVFESNKAISWAEMFDASNVKLARIVKPRDD